MAYRFEGRDLIIDGWEAGMSDNPYKGLADVRNVNIITVPGEASVGFAPTQVSFTALSGTVVSADPDTEIITVSGVTGTILAGQAIIFTGASLPTGITAGTVYWIGNVSGSTFKIYSDFNGTTLVNITATGTGTFASVNIGVPKYWTYDNSGQKAYCVDSNGRAWQYNGVMQYLGNTTLTNASGNGIIAFKGNIFVFRNGRIDYAPITTMVWVYSWNPATGATQDANILNTSAGSANNHEAIIGQDNTVYYTDASYLGSLREVDGQTFAPNNTATYVWTQKALAIPANDIATCLVELGTKLLVGGVYNYIYPWDRISTSFTFPILLSENGIAKMVTVNTNTYILAGNRGRIYYTNGSQAELYAKVPDHLSGGPDPIFTWGGLGYNRNQIYFGLSAKNNAQTAITGYGGLWAIDMTSSALRMTNQLSYGTYAGYASAIFAPPTLTMPSGNGLLIGWDSGASTYGVDITDQNPYTGYTAYIDSEMINIAQLLTKKTFENVEFKLATPLVSGEGIQIYWRTSIKDSYTLAGETTTVGAISDVYTSIIENVQWLQIRVMLKSTQTTPSYTRLYEIRLR